VWRKVVVSQRVLVLWRVFVLWMVFVVRAEDCRAQRGVFSRHGALSASQHERTPEHDNRPLFRRKLSATTTAILSVSSLSVPALSVSAAGQGRAAILSHVSRASLCFS